MEGESVQSIAADFGIPADRIEARLRAAAKFFEQKEQQELAGTARGARERNLSQ
jgi:uncharacterized protein (DUF433 family)